MEETVALLAARAPRLRKAARDAARAGHAYVVLDGTLIPIDRVAADRPFYSGKHKRHGMNLWRGVEWSHTQLSAQFMTSVLSRAFIIKTQPPSWQLDS